MLEENRMKKSILILFGLIVCLTGCQKSENYQEMLDSKKAVLPIYEEDDEALAEESAIISLQDVYTSGYIAEEWTIDTVKSPGGILCMKNNVFVSDCKNDMIFKITYGGEVVQKTGKTGSAEGEFLTPTFIEEYKDEIYVLDQGNNRVQVFDTELNYLRQVKLMNNKKEDPDYIPQALTVNEQGLYVTGVSMRNPTVEHYVDGEGKKEGENFIGSITSDESYSKLYLINSMVRYYDKENDSFGAVSNGPEWMFEMKEGALEKVCELPRGFNVVDFIVNNEKIVAISGMAESIYVLDSDGNYVETIARIPGLAEEDAPQITSHGNEYFIVMPKAQKLYRCYQGE